MSRGALYKHNLGRIPPFSVNSDLEEIQRNAISH